MIIVPSGSSPVLILSLIDEVTVGNNPVTGQTATVAIRRLSDGKWFDFVDVTWDTIATYALLDASNKQALTDNGDGTYGYAWNQATADASDEADYEMTFAVPSGTYQGMAHDTYSFRTKWAVAGDNMGTVTGVSGNVTGSVGSVTGAVGSVTSPVTVGTNNDKTNYALTSAYDAAKTAASAASLATVNGNVDAIKLKTDRIPASPAAVGSAMTLANDAVNSASVADTAVTAIQAGLATSSQVAALNNLSSAQAQAAATAALNAYDPPTKTELDNGLAGLNDLSSAEAQAAATAALAAYDAATGADVPSASTVATAVWANDTRTLSSFGTLAADVASAVWSATTRTLSSFGTLAADVWASATRSLTDKANFTLSSDYDAAKTAASATNLATVDTVVDAIKAKTDNLPASPAATGAAMSLTSAERTALITALLGTSITFPDGNTKTLETIVEEVWAGTAGDYELDGTNWQIKWVDGTNAYVFELDSATAPTMRTRI